jgi:hypothetical protein
MRIYHPGKNVQAISIKDFARAPGKPGFEGRDFSIGHADVRADHTGGSHDVAMPNEQIK